LQSDKDLLLPNPPPHLAK